MTVLRIAVLISLLAVTASAQQQSSVPPASCPVTLTATMPFLPPPQYELDDNTRSF